MNLESKIINGKKISEELNQETKTECQKLKEQFGFKKIPKLVLILVGENPASLIYVSNKKRKAEEIGIISENILLPENITQNELNSLIENLSQDPSVHGILLQMPLPGHLCGFDAIERIAPEKDVDGFHPINSGLLNICQKEKALVPCTPQACLHLLKFCSGLKSLNSLHALIIGRSNIVGWPLTKLLIEENCVITVAHSFAKDLKKLCFQNEIIISAVGKQNLIKEDMVKEDHIIIDVGINRVFEKNNPQKSKLVGDVYFENIVHKVSKITPVPGGVGPMTIAFLMKNVLKAFKIQNKI